MLPKGWKRIHVALASLLGLLLFLGLIEYVRWDSAFSEHLRQQARAKHKLSGICNKNIEQLNLEDLVDNCNAATRTLATSASKVAWEQLANRYNAQAALHMVSDNFGPLVILLFLSAIVMGMIVLYHYAMRTVENNASHSLLTRKNL
jgi:hypothetical protein